MVTPDVAPSKMRSLCRNRRHGISPVALALVVAALVALSVGPSAASDRENSLDDIRRTLDKTRARGELLRHNADELATEIVALKRQLVTFAAGARRQEVEVSKLERRLSALKDEQKERTNALRQRRQEHATIFAALQRLAHRPPIALIALPTSPNDTVRTALLMRGAKARLETEARRLRLDLGTLIALRSEITQRRGRLIGSSKSLTRQRRKLARLIKSKLELERRFRTEGGAARARVIELAREARDLTDLIDRLAAPRGSDAKVSAQRPQLGGKINESTIAARSSATPLPTPTEDRMPTGAAGTVRLPVHGRIVRRFGQDESPGEPAKGISIATRHDAQVVAPETGNVVFAGPFRRYGNLLIIEHGDGYHVLLAGLARIDADVGEEVLAGEPVGTVAPSSGGIPTLYFELRRGGRPINPLPWLAATESKVSG